VSVFFLDGVVVDAVIDIAVIEFEAGLEQQDLVTLLQAGADSPSTHYSGKQSSWPLHCSSCAKRKIEEGGGKKKKKKEKKKKEGK
jgi:hypothetical protein